MKPRPHWTVFPAILLAFAAACAGARVRKDVLIPAMRQAWPGVRSDVEVGTSDPLVLDEARAMTLALDSGNPAEVILIPWPPLDSAARRGIELRLLRREVGPNGAQLLRDRVTQFGESYGRLRR